MASPRETLEDEWLWGWDTTPGIVSVWAEADGRALVWRRVPGAPSAAGDTKSPFPELVREEVRFRPWVLLDSLEDLRHLGGKLRADGDGVGPYRITYRELSGPGELRFLVSADDGRALSEAVLRGASRRMGRGVRSLRELGAERVLVLPAEEQYLVASGRTYFRGLEFAQLARAQLDLETTGLDPEHHRIFLAALRDPHGETHVLEVEKLDDDDAEADLLSRLVAAVSAADPDVIENHNLHGFDLPFLARRARWLGVPLALGRAGSPGLRQRPAARGAALARGSGEPVPTAERPDPRRPESQRPEAMRRSRYTVPGRELIDTLDAVLRHDFSARDLPGHGLKAVARHFGVAREGREYVPGARVYEVFRADPARVRRYAGDDVSEAAGIAHLLGGAAFALARMAPRRYERLADAGPATGVLDPLLVRAYLRAGAALPAHQPGDGTAHSGAALHLFATGVAHHVVKADVASLYPSLMREYRISPARDRLGALLALVDRLVDQRLAAKSLARTLPKGSPERHTQEALSAAMKLVVNSAYGYLGASTLTRFADVHAANEITRRGRALLTFLCRQLAHRGVTLLEADTDGVYFAVPPHWQEPDERRLVAEVAGLLPPKVHLEFDGRYAAMLSHEPKNYALAPYPTANSPSPSAPLPTNQLTNSPAPNSPASNSLAPNSPAPESPAANSPAPNSPAPLLLRGVAFRSSRAEPFGERFLRRAIACLLAGDLPGVREAYVSTVLDLRARRLPTFDVSTLVRLTKSPTQYLATRAARRELPYEALLASPRPTWTPGERIRVYRAPGPRAALLPDRDDDDSPSPTGANSPSPTGANSPSPTGANSPSPTGANSPSPSGANSPSPPGANSPSPTPLLADPTAPTPLLADPTAPTPLLADPTSPTPLLADPTAPNPLLADPTSAPATGLAADPRDYDPDYYVRLLTTTFATRLARALSPEHFAAIVADPEQTTLFPPDLANATPLLTILPDPLLS